MIVEEDAGVFPPLIAFLSIPGSLFDSPDLPTSENTQESAYRDACVYYSFVSEVYHKMMLINDFVKMKPYRSTSVKDAFLTAREQMISTLSQWPLVCGYLLEEFDDCLCKFLEASELLVAPAVLPSEGLELKSFEDALTFLMVGADTLLHLTRLGSAEAYLNSGFTKVVSAPLQSNAYTNILDKYIYASEAMLGKAN